MINLSKAGHLFYGLGIIAYGIQQIVISDFRPQILPDFPAWAHSIVILPHVTGVAMVIAGLIVSGIIKASVSSRERISLYLGFYFFALIFVSHIPYLLFVYPHKLSHLGSWGDLLKELAFSGGSFVVAGSFLLNLPEQENKNSFDRFLEKFIPMGRLFFCTTIILFGCNHFAYDISSMVPKWFVWQSFWSYFGGSALIAAGTAIALKIFLRPVSLLLALMLFLWFLLLHVPGAIANPTIGRGNLIVSAFDALLFCGTALVLSQLQKQENKKTTEFYGANTVQLKNKVGA